MIKYTFETDEPIIAERICKSPAMAHALKRIANLESQYANDLRGMAAEESQTARMIFRNIEIILDESGINLSEI